MLENFHNKMWEEREKLLLMEPNREIEKWALGMNRHFTKHGQT